MDNVKNTNIFEKRKDLKTILNDFIKYLEIENLKNKLKNEY